jgi:hypothetical protein
MNDPQDPSVDLPLEQAKKRLKGLVITMDEQRSTASRTPEAADPAQASARGKQFARVLRGIAAKKESAIEGEYHRSQPKTERDRSDDGKSGERCAAERAERVDNVARERFDQDGTAGVATLIGGKRHRAESRQRPATSVRGAEALSNVLLRLLLDMEGEFLVELVFDSVPGHQRTHAQE